MSCRSFGGTSPAAATIGGKCSSAARRARIASPAGAAKPTGRDLAGSLRAPPAALLTPFRSAALSVQSEPPPLTRATGRRQCESQIPSQLFSQFNWIPPSSTPEQPASVRPSV